MSHRFKHPLFPDDCFLLSGGGEMLQGPSLEAIERILPLIPEVSSENILDFGKWCDLNLTGETFYIWTDRLISRGFYWSDTVEMKYLYVFESHAFPGNICTLVCRSNQTYVWGLTKDLHEYLKTILDRFQVQMSFGKALIFQGDIVSDLVEFLEASNFTLLRKEVESRHVP